MSENTIPDMVHPLSKHWDQPKKEVVLIDDVSACISQESFQQLKEYSMSIPTGVYEGKMWKARFRGKWYLRWFGKENKEGLLPILIREII